jgi:creatinine amidohydrolase/Fe(II)-dependent formamide hydrolase-like protein
MKKVGFIGVGNIGMGMAKSILREGFELTAYDMKEESLKEIGMGQTVKVCQGVLGGLTAVGMAEALRRYTAKKGRPVNLALPPLNYGAHPYHHIGMPGTVNIPQDAVRESLIYVMLGLWNDGFRKQIIINNHGQLWVLESALHEFMYRYQLPGIFQILDWHRGVREFFGPTGKKDSMETHFVHADEAETSVALLMFRDSCYT